MSQSSSLKGDPPLQGYFQSEQVLPPALCLAARMLWQGEGRSGLGRTSSLGSSRGPNRTKWWQNCTLISFTSHWTRPEDGNRCVDTSLMSLAKNARDVELNHLEDERWKDRIRNEREIAEQCTAEWGLRALLIHNMASLSYIRILWPELDRILHLAFWEQQKREEMQHDPSVVQRHPLKVCKGVNAPPVLEF